MTEAEFGASERAGFDRTLSSIIRDNEAMIGTLVGSEGLSYEDGDGSRQVAGPVVVMVTDERIVFATEDGRDVDAGTLSYGDLASVTVKAGDVVFATVDGVKCVLGGHEPVDESLASHLRWVGEIRRRVIARQNDTELATETICDHAWAMEWEEGRERYETAREALDGLITAVQLTRPVPDDVLAPELTPTERSLERGAARLFALRADSELTLCRQLLESEDFEQVRSVLADAREYYDRASDHLAVAERADGFRFGKQRALFEDLDELSVRIEKIRTRPLELADKARKRADSETEPASSVQHLETALDRYRDALAVGVEDPQAVEREQRAVVDSLVEQYRELARAEWNEGADLSETGDRKAAIERWVDAVDSLKRALELAREFDREDRDAIAAQLERVERTLSSLREAESDSEREAESDSEREDSTTRSAADHSIGTDIDRQSRNAEPTTSGGTGESWRDLTGSVAAPEPRESDR